MHVWESRTFVPVGWSCKEQAAVSHSSTEAETISLDAGLSLGGIPALKLWDLVTDVFKNSKLREIGCTTKVKEKKSPTLKDRIIVEIDFAHPNAQNSRQHACLCSKTTML